MKDYASSPCVWWFWTWLFLCSIAIGDEGSRAGVVDGLADSDGCADIVEANVLQAIQKQIAEKKAVLIDVRELSEWKQGHIAGAIHLPLSALGNGADIEKVKKLLPEKQVLYTHCAAGRRCIPAADFLTKLGYDVKALKPGYQELLANGFPKAKDKE